MVYNIFYYYYYLFIATQNHNDQEEYYDNGEYTPRRQRRKRMDPPNFAIPSTSTNSSIQNGTNTTVNNQELQDEYFRRQKELIDYELNLKATKDRETCDYYTRETRKLIKDVSSNILSGLKDLIDYSRRSN